jgi:hypothetical protein
MRPTMTVNPAAARVTQSGNLFTINQCTLTSPQNKESFNSPLKKQVPCTGTFERKKAKK